MTLVLDNTVTGVLGGVEEQQTETIVGDRGQAVALTWTQSGANQDFESYGYSVRFAPAESDAPDTNVVDLNTVTRTAYGAGLYGSGPYSGLAGTGVLQGLFFLDVSTLGTLWLNAVETLIEDRGHFIQVTWVQNKAEQDLELFGYSIRFAPAEPSAMEVV